MTMKRFSLTRWLSNRKPCRRVRMRVGRGVESLEQRVVPALALIGNVEVSSAFPILSFNDRAFFFGQSSNGQGFEPWISDGTPEGTFQIADLNAGPGSSVPSLEAGDAIDNIATLGVQVGSVMYFAANNGTFGTELWRTDGTAAGTRLVSNIASDTTSTTSSSFPRNLTNVNGRLYFSAENNTAGRELWRSDGTAGGTRLVAELTPGSIGGLDVTGNTGRWTSLGDTLLFAGANFGSGFAGQELFVANNSTSTITRLVDINPGAGSSFPQNFVTIRQPSENSLGLVAFVADNGSAGRELWLSNGTPSGTFLVRDINTGSGDGLFGNFSTNFNFDQLTVVGDTLYFRAQDAATGRELWRTDGTTFGTVQVVDALTGGLSSSPDDFANVNGRLFYSALGNSFVRELYRSDGTAATTAVVPSGLTGVSISNVRDTVGLQNFAVFAVDTTSGTSNRSQELWVSDGTAAGTLPANTDRDLNLLDPQRLTSIGNSVYMTVAGASGQRFLARYRLSEPPSDLFLVPSTVDEEVPVGTVVGILTPDDIDLPNDSHTFQFASGAGGQDNGFFRIVGNQLQVNSRLDFEQRATYSIRVRVTDRGGNQLDRALTVTVRDVNELPTDLTLNPGTIVENAPLNSLVGIFAPTDADRLPQTFSYSLVNGAGSADNALFQIIPGENRLLTNAVFDFEARTTYSIRVRVTNDDLDPATPPVIFEKELTILVTNQNEAPTQVTLAGSNVLENQPEGTVVGIVSGTDVDAGDQLQFTVQSTSAFPDGSFFQVVGNQLVTTSELDFEAAPVRTVLIRVTDSGGLFVETPFVINVLNLDDVATTIQLSNTSLPENSPAGTSVGTFSTPVPAYSATLVFQLSPGIGGEDNALFFVDGNQLRVAPGVVLDFESRNQFNIRVKATDQTGLAFEKRFVITLTDVNEAPGPLTLTNATVPEAQPVGALVGLLRAPDPESVDTVTFTLVPGQGSSDNARFRIFGAGLQTNESFNFDVRRFYSVRVRASDQNGNFVEQSFQITITQAPKVTPLFRLFSEPLNYHFFTTSRAEFDAAKAAGFRDETTQLPGVQVLERQLTGSLPLYRLYNLQTRRHYYTTSIGEANFLQDLVRAGMPGFGTTLGWRLEKIEGFIYDTPVGNTVEVFRLYNSRVGTHLFTESAAVRDAVLRAFPTEWSQHSSLGFAYQGQLPPTSASAISASAISAPVVSAAGVSPELSAAPGAAVVAASNRLETLVAVTSSAPVSAAATAATAGETESAAVAPVASTGSVEPEVESLDAVFTAALVGELLD
jgi:ELWxxDGT repeat protein